MPFKDCSEAEIHQGMPGLAGNHQMLGQSRRIDSPLELPEGTNAADTLISDLQSPEL